MSEDATENHVEQPEGDGENPWYDSAGTPIWSVGPQL